MNEKPEAVITWLSDPVPIRRLAVHYDVSNTSHEKSFFEWDSLCRKLSALGLSISKSSPVGLLFRRRFFKRYDALLRLSYTQAESSVGYKTTSGGNATQGRWITKERIEKTHSATSAFTHAVEASLTFSLHTVNGVIFQGSGSNETFPEVLPAWLSCRHVHERTMQQAEDLLLGALSLTSPKTSLHAIKLLIGYSYSHWDRPLSCLSQSSSIADVVADFIEKPPDYVLRECWYFWPDGVRDHRREVREEALRILRSGIISKMLEGGTIALWGNYKLAMLARQNESVTNVLRRLVSSGKRNASLRASSVLILNEDSSAERQILKHAESSDWDTKAIACRNILRYGCERLLRRTSTHNDPGIRRLFWTCPCEFSAVNDEVSESGIALSEDDALRNVCILLLGPFCAIGAQRLAVLSSLATSTLQHDQSYSVRLAAVKALSTLYEYERATPLLSECLRQVMDKDPNMAVREVASNLLQRLSTEE